MQIYYFTGSGNSYIVAKDISEKIGATLIPIASVVSNKSIEINGDSMGIVFPVYFASNDCGIPLIVQRFLKKLSSLEGKYVFAVCTSEHTPGDTLANVAELVKSKNAVLCAGFIVNTSLTTPKDDIKGKLSKAKTTSISRGTLDFSDKISYIVNVVVKRQVIKIEGRTKLAKILMAPLIPFMRLIFTKRYQRLTGHKEKMFMDYINYVDNSFCVSRKCNACGICEKVCPTDNIHIVNEKPKWNNKCENCLACYQFCPSNAIGGKIVEYNKRYHHPNVTVCNMIEQKGKLKEI